MSIYRQYFMSCCLNPAFHGLQERIQNVSMWPSSHREFTEHVCFNSSLRAANQNGLEEDEQEKTM